MGITILENNFLEGAEEAFVLSCSASPNVMPAILALLLKKTPPLLLRAHSQCLTCCGTCYAGASKVTCFKSGGSGTAAVWACRHFVLDAPFSSARDTSTLQRTDIVAKGYGLLHLLISFSLAMHQYQQTLCFPCTATDTLEFLRWIAPQNLPAPTPVGLLMLIRLKLHNTLCRAEMGPPEENFHVAVDMQSLQGVPEAEQQDDPVTPVPAMPEMEVEVLQQQPLAQQHEQLPLQQPPPTLQQVEEGFLKLLEEHGLPSWAEWQDVQRGLSFSDNPRFETVPDDLRCEPA